MLLAVAGVAGYLVYDRAMAIQAEMKQAQRLVPTITSSAAALDFDGAGSAIDEAAVHTAKAVELAAGPTLVPANFAPVDGAIPIQPLIDAQPVVHAAAEQISALDARLEAVDVDGALDMLVSAKSTLADGLGTVSATLDTADAIVSVAPRMLGADGAQTYVVMFLNNAELRSLGGTALSFAEVKVDAGRIELVQALPAGFGNFAITPDPIVPVPEGFGDLWPGAFGTFITNAGVRPSMSSAADVVSANWQREFGRTPDGVVAMDVVALSYILDATGPVQTDGWTIDASNVVDVLLNQVLNAFDSGDAALDNARQDLVYAQFVDQTFARLTSGQFDATAMMDAITKAVDERRIQFHSAVSDIEEVLIDAGQDGGIPDRAGTSGIVGLYINDSFGSKLNYYLDTAVRTDLACGADASSRVTLSLTSTLDPAAVGALNGAVLGQFERANLAPGVQRMRIFAYAPTGSTITGASVDGQPVDLTGNTDAGHAVQVFTVELQPGAAQQLAIDLTVPEGTSGLATVITPTVRAAQVTDAARC